MEQNDDTPDYNRPVAYDVDGKPLYAHPPTEQPVAQSTEPTHTPPQPVYVARPVDLDDTHISDKVKALHDESVASYPELDLSANEYVISTVRRHIIAIVVPFAIGAVMLILILLTALNLSFVAKAIGYEGDLPGASVVLLPALLLALLVVIAMYIIYYVYDHNRFYLTNESVIENIQITLFSKQQQTVSLGNIEDVSFDQMGIIQTLLNYGSIRMSTVGDEDTYRFSYVASPKQEASILNNAVESFKNGRKVGD